MPQINIHLKPILRLIPTGTLIWKRYQTKRNKLEIEFSWLFITLEIRNR